MFQQPEEDEPASLKMTITFICHLCYFLPFSFILTPDNPPSRPPHHPSLDRAAEAARLAVAGQTEPSQVFLWGLVPFNQLLRRHTAAWKQRHSGVVVCDLLTVAVFCFIFISVLLFPVQHCMVIKDWWHHAPPLLSILCHLKVIFAALQMASQL